ncbi:MAG: GTPase domain-containing protein [Lachnospiraceae bacterium]|nr:GTPase domain-containing protein [Lachnospiraceae bacterium]
MRKFMGMALAVWIYIVFLIVTAYCLSNLEKIYNLVSYPAGGNNYISFDVNDEGKIISTVFYRQEWYEGELDLENLELYTLPNHGYLISKDEIYSTDKIRKYLLVHGLAKIANETEASIEELEFQNYATKNEIGIWRSGDSNYSIPSYFILFSKIIELLFSKVGEISLYFFVSVIGIGTFVKILRKIISKRKVDVIFMGGKSSGKSTLVQRLYSPNISEGELLMDATPTKGKEKKRGNRIPYKNKDIYTDLYDNPGDSYGGMVDAINKFGIRKSEKKVVVYVISFTKLNSAKQNKDTLFEWDLVNSQISKAVALITMLKTSKSIQHVKKVIVFFNKCDLLYSNEVLFANSYSDIEVKYKQAKDFDELKGNADVLIFGSALKSWKFNELINEIIK